MWRIFVVLVVVVSCWTVYSVYSQPSFPIPEMVVIPSGSFKMGCVSGIDCGESEKPVHAVSIDSFALSKYEVTFEEYDAFTNATRRERADDEGWGRGRRPVINVSWYDAMAYAEWLSEQTRDRYRLPSEAEWEYAARAGSTTKYSWGNEIGRNRANCDGCGSVWGGERSALVGSFSANGWGLHDMHGNVWEWGLDCWNENYEGAPIDGFAWLSGDCDKRVLRGGSWFNGPGNLRSARRFGRPLMRSWRLHGSPPPNWNPEHQSFNYGFRVLRDL